MAKTRRNEILAGVFFLLAAFLLFLLLFLMGTFESLLRSTREIQVVFNEVQGLREGDPVYYLGQKVGVVRKLEIIELEAPPPDPKKAPGEAMPSKAARVVVTVAMPERFCTLVREDSPVLIDKSITGNLSVLIREGKKRYMHELPECKAGKTVRLQGSVAFDVIETASKVEATLEKVNQLTQEIAEFVDSIKQSGHIDNILMDIRSTTEALRKTAGPLSNKVDKIADEIEGILSENREGIKQTVANLSESSAHVKEVLLRRLEPAAKTLESSLAQMEKASKELETLLARNRGNLNGILDDLRETANNAANLTAEIRRRPWKLLYNPSASEVEVFDLYDSAWAYNLAASSLNRSVQELSALAASKNTDEETQKLIQKLIANLEAGLKRLREAEEAFYNLLKERLR
ncbi:MAG: hypothetical protein HY717_00125 [Planctomycetes bacterium]|nr:hypothetical protein [Planctomycetota bacterium]